MGYTCPRCKKSEGYFAIDGAYSLFFCKDDDCLQDDSWHSKRDAREERERRLKSEQDKKEGEMKDQLKMVFGEHYHKAALSNLTLDDKQSIQFHNWLQNGDNFFVFSGRSGCGKTYMAAAAFNWFTAKSSGAIYIPARSIFYLLKEGIEDSEISENILKRFVNCKLLLIDDLGDGRNNDWHRKNLLDLIDARYSRKKKTFITTKLKYPELAQSVGEDIAGRVYDRNNIFLEDWQTNWRIPSLIKR